MKIFDRIQDWISDLYIVNLYNEIEEWIYIYRTTKKNKEYLTEHNLRLDWLGRPYTVCNVPEDVFQNERDIEPYVIFNLRKYDAIFLKLKLTEELYPEIERIQNAESFAFVFLFTGKREYMKFGKFLKYFIKYGIIIYLIVILVKLIIKHQDIFIQVFDNIKSYL